MQVDFDKLLASEAALQQLEEAADLKSLSRAPGVKSFSESKVTIEFSR